MTPEEREPKTFAELDQQTDAPADGCVRCGRNATHTIKMSVTKIGARASTKQIRARKVCEECAVKLYLVNARALKVIR